jgi:hypothetical protein
MKTERRFTTFDIILVTTLVNAILFAALVGGVYLKVRCTVNVFSVTNIRVRCVDGPLAPPSVPLLPRKYV